MKQTDSFEEELTIFVHDLFLDKEYLDWRKNLKQFESCKWHSLIIGLEKFGSPLERIKSLGESTYSKLVFSYIETPDFKESQMLMIQFTVSGGMWNTLIWHCPERN